LSTGFSADTREALLNCERRIGGSGGKLEKLNAPVSFENEIGERSARVDADAYGFSPDVGQDLQDVSRLTYQSCKNLVNPVYD